MDGNNNTPPGSVHGNTPPVSVHDEESESDNDIDMHDTKISKLDFGNPLYLHASDITNTPLISLKLKGTENYNVWSCAMLLALETKNKKGFIDGTCVRPINNNVLAQQWDRCNAVVLSWILNCVTEELYLGQIFSKNATVVWNELKETYDKVDGVVTFNLHNKINSLCQNGIALSEYYHKLNSLWKQFDALVKLPVCTCHAARDFQSHNQLIKLMQFLMGLDNCYNSVRSQILTQDPLPSVKSAYALLSREESHRNTASNSVNSKTTASAFVAKFSDNKKKFNSGNFGNRGPNTSLNCTNCKGVGHTIDRCYELVGYPPGYKKRFSSQNVQNVHKPLYNSNAVSNKHVVNSDKASASSSSPFTLSNEQMAKLMHLLSNKPEVSGNHANMAGLENQSNSMDW